MQAYLDGDSDIDGPQNAIYIEPETPAKQLDDTVSIIDFFAEAEKNMDITQSISELCHFQATHPNLAYVFLPILPLERDVDGKYHLGQRYGNELKARGISNPLVMNQKYGQIRDFERILLRKLDEYHINYVDLGIVLDSPDLYSDLIHPNDKGIEEIIRHLTQKGYFFQTARLTTSCGRRRLCAAAV